MKQNRGRGQAPLLPPERAAEIFRWGMENHAYLDGGESAARKRALALFFAACLLLAGRRETDGSAVAFLNGRLQNKLFEKYVSDKRGVLRVCHGRFFSSPWTLRKSRTIYSGSARWRRVGLYRGARAEFGERFGKDCPYLWDWIEFCFIKGLMEEPCVKKAVVYGHYDRYTVWISYLAEALGKELELRQHGLIGEGLDLPHKVFCSRVFCYTDKQKEMFARNVVHNGDCAYTVSGFTTVIEFETHPYTAGPLVGISGERNPEDCVAMARGILETTAGAEVVIMPHPGETMEVYERLLAQRPDARIHVALKARYFNIAALVTVRSSLVFDYLAQGYKGAIVAVRNEILSYDIDGDRYHIADSVEDVPAKVAHALAAIAAAG